MSSTYTPNLLEEQGFNENSTTWGTRLNSTIAKIDNMINGWLTKDLSSQSGAYILTALQGQVDEQANSGVLFTGALTADIAIRIPSVAQQHIIANSTSGGFNLKVGTLGGNTYTVPPGDSAWIRCDGTNCFDSINYINGNLTVNGTVGLGTIATLNVSGAATIGGLLTANGSINVTGGIVASSGVNAQTLTSTGDTAVGADLIVTGNAATGGTLNVAGASGFVGLVSVTNTINSTKDVNAGTTLSFAGNVVGTNSIGARTASTSTPSGGANGDIWYQIA